MGNKLLVVYNTCGVLRDHDRGFRNTSFNRYFDYYVNSIEGLLDQDLDGLKVVVSMYKNTIKCKKELAKKFGNKISYVFYDEGKLSVNQTFNRTVQLSVEKFGKFDGYMFLDSGVSFGPVIESHPKYGVVEYERNRFVIGKMYDLLVSGPYALVDGQVDWDAGYEQIGFDYDSNPPAQIRDENFIIPVGKAVNTHIRIWSHEFYEKYDRKLLPDVFAAYCLESVLSFFASAIKKKWVILKDQIVHHAGTVEDPRGSNSADFPKKSAVHNNPWNNLLFERNALDFINDPEAIEAGLGYEECNSIMIHKDDAYDENGDAKHPEKLRQILLKYFLLNKDEFDYDKIKTNEVWGK